MQVFFLCVLPISKSLHKYTGVICIIRQFLYTRAIHFNEHHLSLPLYTGSRGNSFQETQVILKFAKKNIIVIIFFLVMKIVGSDKSLADMDKAKIIEDCAPPPPPPYSVLILPVLNYPSPQPLKRIIEYKEC